MAKRELPGKWLNSIILLLLLAGCGDDTGEQGKVQEQVTPRPAEPAFIQQSPEFIADSAYHYIQQQVDFGPRVPNTAPHRKAAAWLEETLKGFGLEVTVQEAQVTAFNNAVLDIRNIIASINPEASRRIMLFAHWDTRPFADQDSENRNLPIPGANDGGSGTGVLLEAARIMAARPPEIGVDIILFDAEDYGQPEGTLIQRKDDTYCLGSQYWAKNPHKPGYRAEYGILLDMVGAANARFTKEGTSMYFAPAIVNRVWQIASRLGYGDYFVNRQTDPITDDHYYINQLAGIPSIDIIQYDPSTRSNFGSYWHTHDDDMDIIDRTTLKAVGQTVLEVVYREK